jgi:hypothetical protein
MFSPSRRRDILCAGLVVLAAVLPNLSTRDGYFLADDFGVIQVLHTKPLSHFFTLFTRSWTEGIYGNFSDELRPFVALSYQLDALWGAARPLAYHADSLLLHVACALLVSAIARVIAGLSRPAATFAGVLFAVHPVHAEAVAWISGRADTIPALFALGALLSYAVAVEGRRPVAYAACLSLLVCALFSKQSAIVVPILLLLYDALLMKRPDRAWTRRLVTVLPLALATGTYLVLRYALFGNVVREHQLSAGTVVRFLERQPAYLDAILWPTTVVDATVTWRGLGLAVAAGAAGAFLAVWWRRRGLGQGHAPALRVALLFGPVWYLVTVAPMVVTYFSTRHLYLTSAGLTVAAATVADAGWRQRRRAWRVATAVACAGIVVMFARELGRVNASWMDNARTSEALATRARALATSAPDASVLLIDVPWRTIDAYLWAWALPFAVQPPFASEDLTRRTVILSHYWAYCCQQEPWWRDLEARVGRWATLRESGPIFLIGVSPERHIVTATEADVPGLRQALLEVASATTSAAAGARFQDLWRLAHG